MLPTPNRKHLAATYAALYQMAKFIPAPGIGLEILAAIAVESKKLDRPTFDGLISELERRRVVAIVPRGPELVLMRGREYADGLERLRLVGENFRREAE